MPPVGSASWSFTEDDFGAITKSLQRFLNECNARCALLVDRTGAPSAPGAMIAMVALFVLPFLLTLKETAPALRAAPSLSNEPAR